MAVYQVIDLDVHNPELYAQYTAQVTEIIHRYGGRYLVRGGTVHSSSGGWEPKRVVVIIFEKIENLRACYASPAYQAIVHLRQQSSNSKAVVVEGVAPDDLTIIQS